MTFHDHVLQLVDELGAHVWICDTCDDWPEGAISRAQVEDGEGHVYLSHHPDLSTTTYLLALHELGHLACQRGTRRKFVDFRRPVLTDEALAWRWAIDRACITLTAREWCEIHWRLKSYADDRRYKRDTDFDSLLAEAERQAA